MKNKAIHIFVYLILFLFIQFFSLYTIQNFEFTSLWISFTIGALLIFIAIIYTVRNMKTKLSPIIPIVLNSISVSFLVNAYLMKLNMLISLTYIYIILISCTAFYVFYILILYIKWVLKNASGVLIILSIISIVIIIVLWISNNAVLYSNLLFSMIITIAMCICTIIEDEHKNEIDMSVVVVSFSSLFVLIIVLCLLLESGDIPVDFGEVFKSNGNRKAPQNIQF